MNIVPFHPALQTAVVELILGIQRDEFGFAIRIEDQPDLVDIPNFYQSGRGGFWVALEGEQVVGTIALKDIGEYQGALRKMFVANSHRGPRHGIGAALLNRLIEHAHHVGVHEIFLGTTEKFLAAHRFYEKHQFERVAPEDLPQSFPRMGLDTRFYQRRLRPLLGLPR